MSFSLSVPVRPKMRDLRGPTRRIGLLVQTLPELLPERTKSQDWIKFALDKLYVKNFKELSADLEKLDHHLNFRSFVVGYHTPWLILPCGVS
ncbi:hypothetical protein Cantr_01211 [Candida viswanathii]|uniref:Uncharacterized protein n=1 Tax=Candida viswanathii TaxID=5486 RepID=A0A367YI42_9ASCO|nr:hypothetical protein Cantr_01211 [Candida viswanathii]